MEPASYAPTADCVGHLVRVGDHDCDHGDGGDGGGDDDNDGDHSDDGDGNHSDDDGGGDDGDGDHDCGDGVDDGGDGDHSDGGDGDHSDDGDGGVDDGDNVHLTFSSFSLPLDDGPARWQSSSLAIPPDHFPRHIRSHRQYC